MPLPPRPRRPTAGFTAVISRSVTPTEYIEIRDRAKDVIISEEDIRRHLIERIAKFKTPDRIEFCDLPKTATGKVQKFELKKLL